MFATKTAPRRKGNLDIRQPQKALSLLPKPLKAGVRHGSTVNSDLLQRWGLTPMC